MADKNIMDDDGPLLLAVSLETQGMHADLSLMSRNIEHNLGSSLVWMKECLSWKSP
jgi:hypothetical protein